MQSVKKIIQAKAKNLGFSFIGFSSVKQTPHFKEYEKWVRDGMAGDMHYLTKSHTIENRRNPQLILEEGQTVIVLGINYSLKDKIEIVHNSKYPGYVRIAAYALHPDYHDNLKKNVWI